MGEGKVPRKKIVFEKTRVYLLLQVYLLNFYNKNSQDVRRRRSSGDGHRQWIRHVQSRLRRRRGPVQERYPLFEIPHRARHRDQLGRHGEGLPTSPLISTPRLPSTPRLTGRRWSRSFSRPSTPQQLTSASRPSSPSTLPVVPPVSSSTSEMVSPTPSPSMRVTPFPTPSCVSTWPDAT